MKENAITRYALDHYVSENNLCSLCGNRGVIDTRKTAISAAGVKAGRVNFCICPNGQGLRRHEAAFAEMGDERLTPR